MFQPSEDEKSISSVNRRGSFTSLDGLHRAFAPLAKDPIETLTLRRAGV